MRRFLISLIFVVFVCFAGTSEARKLALLVGVDEYDAIPSLKCCVNDMKMLKEALVNVGFEENDIQLLATDGKYRDFPTKKKIEQRIESILSEAEKTDMIFFAFSGHGAQDGDKVYFCPPDVDVTDLDGTCVSITKVMDDLANSQAQFKWMVVDACRNDPKQRARAIGGKGLLTISTPPSGIALFQSCAEGEESWEDRASGNGYFTKNFAAALSGAADVNHDGKLMLMEVCSWTTSQTKDQVLATQNKSQKPYFSGTVSDFVLIENTGISKAKTLAAEAEKAVDSDDYDLAIKKFDEALALCPQFDSWKRERKLVQKLVEKEEALQEALKSSKKVAITSREAFEWEGTKIKKYIGKENNVVIPEGTTEICSHAFSYCAYLTSIEIPECVTEIGGYAFSNCKALTSVVIHEGVKKIGEDAFQNCEILSSIEIPETVTEIGSSAFSCCYGLTSAIIHGNIKKIESGLFFACRSLESVAIPDSVEEIVPFAFASCSSLKKWDISSEHPYLKTNGGALLTKDGKKLLFCPTAKGEYRIPEGVTEIGNAAFEYCKSVTSVIINKDVTVIGDDAFQGCESLMSVDIPDSVLEIGARAFARCPSLRKWSISSSHPAYKTDGTCLLTKDGKKIIGCLGTVKEYTIPAAVTEIGEYAFAECRSLTSIIIPEGVTEIGREAFYDCSSLKSVNIPQSVKKIGSDAFYSCDSLTSIVIPKGVIEIEYGAFSYCDALTSVVISEGVTKIGSSAFNNCKSLTSVEIPKSVTEIDYSAFRYGQYGSPNLTLYAPAGSKAEEYAKEHEIPFKVKNTTSGNSNTSRGQNYYRRRF